ncbi:MAG: UvrD-helicase domain-containing protein [Gallionellaceae bacterium]|nr:UvrD-helicase domain-containing protein [Gallionellaceae bacterium]
MTAANPLLPALEPKHCAVVEACAGSGKTWLLVSRMLRLLLAGAAPAELLAITFTRKAAAEMQARLDTWLADLALLPDAEALDFLEQRGLSGAAALAALPAARGLLEKVLASPPMITTFHGWFFHLIARAPLPLRLPGEVLEDAALLREEAWFALAETLGRKRGGPEEAAFRELASEFSLSSLRGLLNALLARRAEWWAAGQGHDDPVAAARAALEARLGVSEAEDVAATLLADTRFGGDLAEYQQLLARNGAMGLKTDVERAEQLARAASLVEIAPILLTQAGTVRACKLSDALGKRLGGDASIYVELHHHLAEQILQTLDRLAEQRALRLNRLVLTVGQAYLDTYQRLKNERGGLDFSDGELEAARLLDDDEAAGAILSRLDARWKHLLLDEFQDSNPLQWRILQAWLTAYGADGARPTVFLVGDPKQSIYRFRRAEPRLFAVAADWLEANFQARHFPLNETRRCAPRVVAWVNAVFSGRADYPLFTTHGAHQTALPGHCELRLAAADGDSTEAPIAFRNPLTQAPTRAPHKREQEAAWVARRISEIVGHLVLADGGPATYGDITLLYGKRRDLDVFEAAFKTAGIPFIGDRRGGLLASLEAMDLMALLGVLSSPLDDLALAQTLKCPVFGFSDDDLKHLAIPPSSPAGGEGATTDPALPPDPAAFPLPGGEGAKHWWRRLHDWAAQADAPPHVTRAARLLDTWRGAAGHLPVHDLLDRVFHEGEVIERYGAAVAAHLRAGVLANLEGLLGLSLGLSGGRFPSLPRFLDELKQLRDKAGQDAPDEPPASDGDAVRMLTIHAAKGLEAPVVFLIKADEGEGRDEHSGVIMDWPPGQERPAHFSIHGPKAWRGGGRDDLFAREAKQAAREHLNLLYVAMTRARQALFVTGLQEPGKAPAHWLGLLKTALEQAEMAGLPEMALLPPPPGYRRVGASSEGRGEGAALDQAQTSNQPSFPLPQPLPQGGRGEIPPIGQLRPPSGPEAAFGSAVHVCLEWITEGVEMNDAVRKLTATYGLGPEASDRVIAAARRILAIAELAPAFDPARYRRAHNELEFLDGDGGTFRIDRLVEFSEEIWVLDYKTGGLDEADLSRRALPYLEQIEGYRAAARQLYPGRPVRAALVFADGSVEWLV